MAIYGSSRAWLHIDPEIIEDSLDLTSYNFGIDGHNFRLQYLRHLEYLRKNNKPHIILHSIDIFTLQYEHDLFHMEQFLPFMLWNNNIRKYTSNIQWLFQIGLCCAFTKVFKSTNSIIAIREAGI